MLTFLQFLEIPHDDHSITPFISVFSVPSNKVVIIVSKMFVHLLLVQRVSSL